MIKNLKKAFTIIELVIVIAVIAVLAAVLIPTFSSLVDKANNNVDTQLIRNLNVALRADVTNGEKHKTMHSALLCAKDAGYDIQKINAQGADNEILWDSVNDVFCYYDNKDDKVKYVPESNIEEGSIQKVDYFKIYQEIPDISDQTYSIYLNNDFISEDITVKVGFDAGNNNNITIIKYTGKDEVVIRTLGNCKFIVSGTTGTVHHYGAAASESGEHDCHANVIDGSEYTEEDLRNLQFAGGQGTKESPYLVANSEQFEAFLKLDSSQPKYIKLIDDVKYDSSKCQGGSFNGILDGNGHTIYYNLSESYPALFGGNNGDTIIKDLNWVSEDGVFGSLIFYINDNTITTFENITVSSQKVNSERSNYAGSAFCALVINATVYFKNCISNLNYSMNTGANGTKYGGIFIGNYPQNSFISFENCINKGTVTGQYVGFFIGNTTRKIELTENSTPTYESKCSIIYVNNCKNEGIMIGTDGVSAFGCNNSTYLTNHEEASNAVKNDGLFIPGTMIKGNIDSKFIKNGNNLIIKDNKNATIVKYEVGCTVNIKYIDGSGAFTYKEKVLRDEIGNYKFGIINRIIAKKDFKGDYGSYKEESNDIFNYIIVLNADGTRDIIVNTDNISNFEKFSTTLYYSIAAYDSNNNMIGYNNYELSEIATE